MFSLYLCLDKNKRRCWKTDCCVLICKCEQKFDMQGVFMGHHALYNTSQIRENSSSGNIGVKLCSGCGLCKYYQVYTNDLLL